MREHAQHLHRQLQREGAWTQRVMVTVLAAGSAWTIGSLIDSTDALVAAIVAVITLRVSVQASVTEALNQTIGTLLGVAVALGGLAVFGSGTAAVAATVGACFIAARVLRLGDEGGLNTSITSLIVLGPGLAAENASNRILGTFLGVAVALVFSYWAHPATPLARTQSLVAELAGGAAELLEAIAAGVSNGYSTEEAGQWLLQARTLTESTQNARAQAIEALRYARWSPLASRAEAEAAWRRFIAAEHTIVQVRNMARAFFDASHNGTGLHAQLAERVGEVIATASTAVQHEAVQIATDKRRVADQDHIEVLRADSREALQAMAATGDEREIMLGASVLSGVERIADSLSAEAPAITEVPHPGEPEAALPHVEAGMEMVNTVGEALRRTSRTRRRRR